MAFLRSAPLVRRLLTPASGRKILSASGGFLAAFHACMYVDMWRSIAILQIIIPATSKRTRELASLLACCDCLLATLPSVPSGE